MVGDGKMEVRLIKWFEEPEELASATMHGCKTTKTYDEVASETPPEQVKNRVRSAIKLGHFTVAGFTEWVFEIRGVSRALTHQLVRHRMAWYLQQSQRSVDPTDGDEWYVIPPKISENWVVREIYILYMKTFKTLYNSFIGMGIPKEDARFVLPNATKSNIYMKIDGSNLMHFLKLRLDRHAQWEIRELAQKIYSLVREKAPNLFSEDLQEYWW